MATPDPLELWVEPTNRCNAKCPLCPTGSGQMTRPQGFLDFELYKLAVMEARPKLIRFWNYGEPFLHPDIFQMIRFASDLEIDTEASTNGVVFYQEESYLQLLQCGLKRLLVGLDGTDAETFNQYRVGVEFDKVMQGLRAFLSYQPRLPMAVIWQFIVMQHNEHQLETARALAESLGMMFLPKSVNLDLLPEQADLTHLPEAERYRRYALDGSLMGGWKPCHFVETTLVLNWNGLVTPCCYDAQGQLALGDATTESLTTIWHGDKLAQLRTQLATARSELSPCNKCPVGHPLFKP